MTRLTFSIFCAVIIFAVFAGEFAVQADDYSGVCAYNEDCKIVEGIPTCVCKYGWKRLSNSNICYWVCKDDADCHRNDYCTLDHQCKPR